MEGDAFQDTCQNNGLSKVGLIDETIVQPWEGDGMPAESDSSGNPFLGVGESGLHAKHVEEVTHHGVALQRTVGESGKMHFGVLVGQRHHLIPIGCRCPIVLDKIWFGVIGVRFHFNAVGTSPFHLGTEITHGAQSQFDIGL